MNVVQDLKTNLIRYSICARWTKFINEAKSVLVSWPHSTLQRYLPPKRTRLAKRIKISRKKQKEKRKKRRNKARGNATRKPQPSCVTGASKCCPKLCSLNPISRWLRSAKDCANLGMRGRRAKATGADRHAFCGKSCRRIFFESGEPKKTSPQPPQQVSKIMGAWSLLHIFLNKQY